MMTKNYHDNGQCNNQLGDKEQKQQQMTTTTNKDEKS